MSTSKFILPFLASVFITNAALAQQNPVSRKTLFNLTIQKQQVAKIEMQEITMAAGVSAPKHLHPCTVTGILKSGTILFQIEGEEKIILNPGDSFYEPKDKIILHFDNTSSTDVATFTAIYLKEGNEDNIKIIKP